MENFGVEVGSLIYQKIIPPVGDTKCLFLWHRFKVRCNYFLFRKQLHIANRAVPYIMFLCELNTQNRVGHWQFRK